jgi:hypothetical protein
LGFVRPLARLLEGKAMAVATPINVQRVVQTQRTTRLSEESNAADDPGTAPTLQAFLEHNGLVGWMDSDEGRCYLLHVCMLRGRAAA